MATCAESGEGEYTLTLSQDELDVLYQVVCNVAGQESLYPRCISDGIDAAVCPFVSDDAMIKYPLHPERNEIMFVAFEGSRPEQFFRDDWNLS